MRLRFLCDVDDILTPFCDRAIPLFEVVRPGWSYDLLDPDEWDLFTTLNTPQRNMVAAVMSQPGFCYGFQMASGSWEGIQALRQEGCDVFAVTAPNVWPNWGSERILWLLDMFDIPCNHVIQTEAKYTIQGEFMLDDRLEHVKAWAQDNPLGVAMMWSTPHNARSRAGDDYRVEGWDAVLKKVQAYKHAQGHLG